MENKKVINATPSTLNGITFKSKLEGRLFKILEEEGFHPQYEPFKFHIWEGFKPNIPFYERNKTKSIALNSKKIIDITYTPDIVFEFNGYTVFIEVKPDNFTNDVYPYKQKIFRKYLEEDLVDMHPIFARIGNVRNLREFTEILKTKYAPIYAPN